jgi:hypothetical protein
VIALRGLARYAMPQPASSEPAHCELCSAPIDDLHRHVFDSGSADPSPARSVRCACQACAVLFASGTRFRTVPDRVRRDATFALDAAGWAHLGVPVALAFLVRSGSATRVGYPGPAGVIDGELDDTVWARVADATPLAGELADDVEALLVHGERGARQLACYLVPITRAYELAGALRETWQGFSGGDAATAMLSRFFTALDRDAARGGP